MRQFLETLYKLDINRTKLIDSPFSVLKIYKSFLLQNVRDYAILLTEINLVIINLNLQLFESFYRKTRKEYKSVILTGFY